MKLRSVFAAVGVAGLLLLPATAAQAAPSDQDAAWMKSAHQSNLAEIAGGKLAQQKGNSQAVKDLGARFVADHTKLDAALTKLASAQDVKLPSAPNEKQQAVAARYRATSGGAFDTLFISTQMDSHMAAMAAGEKEIANGSDDKVVGAAKSAAPVIASHHNALNAAARDLGLPASIGTGTGEAAHRALTTPVIGLLGLGMLLLVAAVVLLRRRQPAGR